MHPDLSSSRGPSRRDLLRRAGSAGTSSSDSGAGRGHPGLVSDGTESATPVTRAALGASARRWERHVPTVRKLAMATWRPPGQGVIHGSVDADVSRTLPYLERAAAAAGRPVTLTALVGKAVALALVAAPQLNARVVAGRVRRLPTVDVSFFVDVAAGRDLSAVTVAGADTASLAQIAERLGRDAADARAGVEPRLRSARRLAQRLPVPLLRGAMWAAGLVTAGYGRPLPSLGLPADPFGGALVTSLGMHGVDVAFAPLVPFTRVATVVLVGAVRDRPAVVDGQVVARPLVTLTATLDHRLIDGVEAARLAALLRRVVEDPEAALGPPDESGH